MLGCHVQLWPEPLPGEMFPVFSFGDLTFAPLISFGLIFVDGVRKLPVHSARVDIQHGFLRTLSLTH